MKVPQEDELCLRSGLQAEVTHHPNYLCFTILRTKFTVLSMEVNRLA